MCVQYSTTYFNTTYGTNIPISFQTLVGEVALILPFTFQDLRPSATLLAPGDQQEEAPSQQEDQEPARDPEVPPLPCGSLETNVSTMLLFKIFYYSYTVQCDLTYCLPILLRRSPPQNCVLHCRHLCLLMTKWTGCQERWGGRPSKWNGSRRRRSDEEEVTIINITPS